MKRKFDRAVESHNSSSTKAGEMPPLSLPASCASSKSDMPISLLPQQKKPSSDGNTCLSILKKMRVETTETTKSTPYVPKSSFEDLELLGLLDDLDDLLM